MLSEISEGKTPDPRVFGASPTSQVLSINIPRELRFKFSSLPPEVRVMIYEYVLLSSDNNTDTKRCPAFLRALQLYGSTELYDEATVTFYSINNFTFKILGCKKQGFIAAHREIFGFVQCLSLCSP